MIRLPMTNGKIALPLCPTLDIKVIADVCILRGRSFEAVWIATV